MCPKLWGLKTGSSLLVFLDSLHFHTSVRNTLTSADFERIASKLQISLKKTCAFYTNTWICVYGTALDPLKPSLISLGRILWGFPGSSVGKESACKAGDLGLIPGLGRSPGEGNGNPLRYSCLENSMARRAWWATVDGAARVGHNLATKPPV